MKGFMRQRGASWELRVYLGPDPLTGKKRYATRTVRGGKREAQTALAEMVTEAERGLTVRTSGDGRGVARGLVRVRRARLLAEDGQGDTRLHRPLADAGARVEAIGQTQARRSRCVLPSTAHFGRVRRPPVGARDGETHPRHSAACAQPGSQVGVDRHQPCDGNHAAARAAVGHQTAVAGVARTSAPASGGGLTGSGLLPDACRRHRRPSVRVDCASMDGH